MILSRKRRDIGSHLNLYCCILKLSHSQGTNILSAYDIIAIFSQKFAVTRRFEWYMSCLKWIKTSRDTWLQTRQKSWPGEKRLGRSALWRHSRRKSQCEAKNSQNNHFSVNVCIWTCTFYANVTLSLYFENFGGNGSNFEIWVKCKVDIEMSVMCDISCLFSKEFFAVKPLKHIGLSDMKELIHMKIHELRTKGCFKLLAE